MNKRTLWAIVFFGIVFAAALLWRQFLPPEDPLQAVSEEVSAIPGGVATLAYRIDHVEAGTYNLTLAKHEDWQAVRLPESIEVDGATTFFINLQVPQQAETGPYPVVVALRKGNRYSMAESKVIVPSVAVPRLTSSLQQLEVEEGDPLLLDYALTNIGNRPGRFSLEMEHVPEGWLINVLESSPELQPGESATITVQAIVAKGVSMERQELVFTAKGGGQQSDVLLKVYVLPESQD